MLHNKLLFHLYCILCVLAGLILCGWVASQAFYFNEQILLMLSRPTVLIFVACIGTCHICHDTNTGVTLVQLCYVWLLN